LLTVSGTGGIICRKRNLSFSPMAGRLPPLVSLT
jgi:hypothetical protein